MWLADKPGIASTKVDANARGRAHPAVAQTASICVNNHDAIPCIWHLVGGLCLLGGGFLDPIQSVLICREHGRRCRFGCASKGPDKCLGFRPRVKLLELGPLPPYNRLLCGRPFCVHAGLAPNCDAVESGRLALGRGVAAGGEGRSVFVAEEGFDCGACQRGNRRLGA
jgi:hypothetical protein